MSGTDETPETAPDGQVADAERGNWVDRWAPKATRPYLRLSRLDRPSPALLLFWPCLWGLIPAALASGMFTLSHLWIAVGCLFGAYLMRGAGCTWNDITDREFDAAVARTRSRPIPSGQVTVRKAVIWMVAQSLAAFGILLTFSPLAIGLGIASLALVCVYPFAKRFTWWPQVFLGLAFNWGVLVAWAAVTGSLTWAPVLIYIAGIAWTLFYDTIYAHQDAEDDALIGVKSTARLFGSLTPTWLRRFLVIAVSLQGMAVILAVVGAVNGFGPYAVLVALCGTWAYGWHLQWQLAQFDPDNGAKLITLFRSNRDAGLLPLPFFAAALFL